MKAMKFRVKDEQHSKEIQEALFAAGYGWGRYKTTIVENENKSFLYAEEDGSILYSCERDSTTFFDVQDNEETILCMGSFISALIKPITPQPTEKPLVRPRKQFLQERQVELLRGLLAQAEAGDSLDDGLVSELTEIKLSLRYCD